MNGYQFYDDGWAVWTPNPPNRPLENPIPPNGTLSCRECRHYDHPNVCVKNLPDGNGISLGSLRYGCADFQPPERVVRLLGDELHHPSRIIRDEDSPVYVDDIQISTSSSLMERTPRHCRFCDAGRDDSPYVYVCGSQLMKYPPYEMVRSKHCLEREVKKLRDMNERLVLALNGNTPEIREPERHKLPPRRLEKE